MCAKVYLCRQHMQQKLVPVVWYQKLARVGQSGTSFLHTFEHSSVTSQKLSSTWHEPWNVIGRRVVLVQETVMNLRQIFRASFWYQFLVHVLPAIVYHMWPENNNKNKKEQTKTQKPYEHRVQFRSEWANRSWRERFVKQMGFKPAVRD